MVGLEDAALDHVVDTARSTDDDLRAVLESLHVLTDVGTTNTGVTLDAHEVTDGDDDLLDLLGQLASGSEDESLAGLEVGIDLLESRDRESGSLSGTGLGLSDNVGAYIRKVVSICREGCNGILSEHTLDDWHDSALLDSRGALETVGIDTTEKLWAKVHRIEGVGDLVIVRLDLSCNSRKSTMLAMP